MAAVRSYVRTVIKVLQCTQSAVGLHTAVEIRTGSAESDVCRAHYHTTPQCHPRVAAGGILAAAKRLEPVSVYEQSLKTTKAFLFEKSAD